MYTIDQLELRRDDLYAELNMVRNMTEYEVCEAYNADCAHDIIESIVDEIDSIEDQIAELQESDDGMDYDLLCHAVGISRFAF